MRTTVIALAAAIAATAAISSMANASPLAAAGPQSHAQNAAVLEQIDFRDRYHRRKFSRCSYWRAECADRWGWGTWRFHRCLIRHACGR